MSDGTAPRRTQGFRVIRWIESYCCHSQGQWIGLPFRLLPWQKRLILQLFEVGDDGLRRYRWVLVGVPKKNGKTDLLAALCLYLLIGDEEPSPLIVCAAASEEQADLVFGAAKTMCTLSDPLAAITECYDKEILVPSIPGARMQRVAAVAGTNDGKNIHAGAYDEFHEWAGAKGQKVWEVLTNASGARRQPLHLHFTTAGHDKEGTVCGKLYQHGKDIEAGLVEDPRFLLFWIEAPAEADYREPAVWEAANPSYGVLVHPDFFADQLTKKTESVFRRYFLNQWVTSEEIWIPYGVWDACQSDLELDPTLPVYVGIDLAKTIDSSALAMVQPQGERFVVRSHIWANPYPPSHSLHDGWRMNNNLVMDVCRELYGTYRTAACQIGSTIMPGPCFGYDPWRFREEADALTGEGLAMVEFPQNDSRMVPASQALFEAIMKTRLAHDGDPGLKAHVHHVTADMRARGWRMSKPEGSTRKIDAAIATAIAVYLAQTMVPPTPRRSAYDDHGLLAVGR